MNTNTNTNIYTLGGAAGHLGRARDREMAGLTLVELMVAIGVLSALLAIALPSFSRDQRADQFGQFIAELRTDIERAKMESMASREDRALLLARNGYQLTAVIPGTVAHGLLRQVRLPEGYTIAGVSSDINAREPQGGFQDAEVRFPGTNRLLVDLTGSAGLTPQSLVIFLECEGQSARRRVLVFEATGYTELRTGW